MYSVLHYGFSFISCWPIVCRKDLSSALWRLSLKISQLSQTFFSPSIVVFHEILPRKLNKLKTAVLKCHVVTVCTGSCTVHYPICLSHFSQDFKLPNFMFVMAKATLDFHISGSSLLVLGHTLPAHNSGFRTSCVLGSAIMKLPEAFKFRLCLLPVLVNEVYNRLLAQHHQCWTLIFSPKVLTSSKQSSVCCSQPFV